jgi:hypothetical protein
MASDRLIAILTLLSERTVPGQQGGRLCGVAAEVTEMSGAGIALLSNGEELTSLCTSNEIAHALMDIELTVGEGPCVDASRSSGTVEEVELLSSMSSRWLGYAPSAGATGARAVFGFPIRIGAIRLGALSLFRDRAGPLSESQTSDAHLMAVVIGRAVLAMQAGTPQDMIAGELEREATFDFAVHQAAGMVAVQGSMSVGNALVALRAHAFSTGSTSAALAARIVAREIRYDPATGEWPESEVPT